MDSAVKRIDVDNCGSSYMYGLHHLEGIMMIVYAPLIIKIHLMF
jgi:hypothetical protein